MDNINELIGKKSGFFTAEKVVKLKMSKVIYKCDWGKEKLMTKILLL